jgi:hypothetical protein
MDWPHRLGFDIGPFLRLSEFGKMACVCREWNIACRPMLTRLKGAMTYQSEPWPWWPEHMKREFQGGVKRHDFRNHFEPGATQLRPLFRNLLLLNVLRNRWVPPPLGT